MTNDWVTGEYPGEKVQVDVKYVPKKCMSKKLQEIIEKYKSQGESSLAI